jgi:hypothetical protein
MPKRRLFGFFWAMFKSFFLFYLLGLSMVVELGGSEYFFRAKPVKAIITLNNGKKDWHASSLAKEIDYTFPPTLKNLSKFQKRGFVSFSVEGRKKLVFLTAKGRRLAAIFAKLISTT